MIKIDDREIQELVADLRKFNDLAYPFAAKGTVNSAAFKGREIWQKKIERNFTLRNQWTKRSVRVEQTRTLDTRRQMAVLGSVADYMEDAEFGGVKTKKGKHGVVIPTASSSGEGEVARPRQRLPRGSNKLQRIKLQRQSIRARNRKQRNLIAIRQAIASKKKYVFLDFEKHPGIYKIMGRRGNENIRLMYDLSEDSVRIPSTPTLKPAVDITQILIPDIYKKELRNQLRRLGILK